MRSVFDAVKVATAVRPTTRTGTGTPTAAAVSAVDTFGYNTGMFSVTTGSATGTPVTYIVAIQVQESADGSTGWTDVSGATGTITGTTTSATLNAQVRVEGLGTSRLRYLRVVPLVTMTTNDGQVLPITAHCLLSRAFREPVGNAASG